MQLLNVGLARSTWLFPVEDINPEGLDFIAVLAAVHNRYRFNRNPPEADDFPPPNGIIFKNGTYRLQDGRVVAVSNLSIFKDGLIADTYHSTSVTDQFLEDLLLFISSNHGMRFEPKMVRVKRYVSELVVQSDLDLDQLCQKLVRFEEFLRSSTEPRTPFKTSGVAFSTDPENPSDARQFRIERRVGSRKEENRYYSQAPFQTDHHLRAIQELERILVD